MFSKFGKYLVEKQLRANLAALICVLLPVWPLNLVAAVIVALLTLQRGVVSGLSVLAWVLLPVIATTAMNWHQLSAITLYYDVTFISCLFTWLFASMLRVTRSWSRLLEVLMVLGAVVVASLYLLPNGVATSAASQLKQVVVQSITPMLQSDPDVLAKFKQISPVLMLGLLYAGKAFVALLLVMLARVWQLSMLMPGQRREEFYNIRSGRVVATIATLLVLVAFFKHSEWLAAMMPVVLIMFAVSTFSLARHVALAKNSKLIFILVLVIALALLVFAPPVALVLFALLCVADSWVDVRRLTIFRIKRVNS